MTLTLMFLGKGGSGRTTMAIAAAKKYAGQGKKVLLMGQTAGPALGMMLGTELGPDPVEVAPNFQALQIQATTLLERGWDEVKNLEKEYVRTPFFRDVYGQELGVLPGMEGALALYEVKKYEADQKYDVIVLDGTGDKEMLRLIGAPEIMSWYIRRFRQVILDSDVIKAVSPFIQPLSSAVLNVDWAADNFAQPTDQVNKLIDTAKDAIANPQRVAAYLVSTGDPMAIATARYLWGSAQQANLTVGGVILNQTEVNDQIASEFDPLPVVSVPNRPTDNWQPLIDALPDFSQAAMAPRPITINEAQSQVSLFLPSFDKKHIKLTQYGPEVTIEAGDQRRNIYLPPSLRGKPVTGAKFQNGYLTITF